MPLPNSYYLRYKAITGTVAAAVVVVVAVVATRWSEVGRKYGSTVLDCIEWSVISIVS
jgi:hypothetical protein